MTHPEFQSLFDGIFHSLPDYAKDAISRYIATGATSEILIDNDAADKMEAKGTQVPAAALLDSPPRWYFVFRPFLLVQCPKDILSTIVRHEMAHAFLIAVERCPTPESKREVDRYRRLVDSLSTLIALPDKYDMTEDLISIINDDWGSDEMAAKTWLQARASN